MRSIVIGTAGHIDHGKSALVRALTGTDPDRLKAEKDRGITIDLGFAHYQQDADTVVSFIDVPGHERFVKNMLAGISGIHAVLLVVAADESVMPQSREHFDICRLLHVAGGVIALTKVDLVDEETLELARLEVRELVADSFLASAPIVPVSAKQGEGLSALRAALGQLARSAAGPSRNQAVRLPIDRVFSVKGFGTIITGTLASGQIDVDRELEVLPEGRRVKVRGIQVHGERRPSAEAGHRAAVNLGGVDRADVSRGDTLATPGCFESTRRFDAVLDLLPGTRPLRHGARVRFHHGTCEVLGRVAVSSPVTRPSPAEPSATPSASTEVAPGSCAYVRVRLERPVVLTRGDRYVLRAYSPSITIAGGHVLDPQPPRRGIRTAAARVRFERLRGAQNGVDQAPELDNAAGVMLEEQASTGMPVRSLTTRAGVSPDRVDEVTQRLVDGDVAVRVGDTLVAPSVLTRASTRLLDALRSYHQAQPLSEGLPREEARERLFGKANPAIFERLLADLVAAQAITARDRLALADHQVSLSAEETRAREGIERAYRDAGLRPPDPASVQAAAQVRVDIADRVTKLLLRQKVLVKVDALVFHASVLQRLKDEMAALKAAAGGQATIDVATFKERYGITRKYAIPLLEYLDRERITRRVRESRVII